MFDVARSGHTSPYGKFEIDALDQIIADEYGGQLSGNTLVHAQFETIHPFLDGNGRIGRLLIAALLEQWRRLPEPLLYLSGYLKQHQAEYYRRLLDAPKTLPASYRLFEMLPMMPCFTIGRVGKHPGTSFPTAAAAVKILEDLDIVTEMTGQEKNRSYGYQRYIELLSADQR